MSNNIQLLTPGDNSRSVIILTCIGGNIATKTHRRAPNGSLFTDGFNAGKYFDYQEAEFDDLHGLLDAITKASADPKKLIIRGQLRADAPQRKDGCVRRCNRKQSDGKEPYFEDADRAWVMIDLDKVENPEGFDPASVEAMEYLRSLLPPEFRDVGCIYSLSSSAGLSDSDRVSGHLWFILNRPASNQELKAWLSGYPVDMALFQCVQAHYIASPVFRDGIIDPVDERNGLLSGSTNVVCVPEIDTNKSTYKCHGNGRGLEGAYGYEAKIALLGDGDGKEGCHAVITSAIASYMTRHGPQADREALKADVRARAAAAPWNRAAHNEGYVAQQVSDETLDRSIQDWVDKTRTKTEGYAISQPDDVDVARGKVEQAAGHFISSAKRWHEGHYCRKKLIKEGSVGFFEINEKYVYDMFPPPRHALATQVGLGKTEVYLSLLGELAAILRGGHCIFIGVSGHKLSHELKQRARRHGMDAEVYLGPSQEDPDQPGRTMCWVPDWLAVFQKTNNGPDLCNACQHRHECGFQKQRMKKSQIWIGAHQLLYRKRSLPIQTVDFVIIDEDPLSAGLEGNDPKHPKWLSCDDVSDDVRKAIEQLPIGLPFSRVNFTVGDGRLHDLIRQNFGKIEKVEISSDATNVEIEDAFIKMQVNSRLIEVTQFYREIAGKGPWGMRPYRLRNGATGLQWVRQRKIHSDFDVPTLFADATFNEDAVESIIDVERPQVEDCGTWIDEDGSIVNTLHECWQPVIIGPVSKINARTPYATFRQVLFSAAAGLFKGVSGDNTLGRVRRYIEGRSAGFRSVLVICQLDLERKLSELGSPPNVKLAHFNAIRGQDKWKDVDLLIVIGRTQPKPISMELQAEAVFRTPIKSLGPDYYDRAWLMLTGTETEVPTERHPDPHAEAMRWHACEAELIQAIGRGRAVNRTAENPVQIDIINNVPLPNIEIDKVIEWDDAQAHPGAVIAGRHGLLLSEKSSKGTSNVVAALLMDLFGSVGAAKQAKVYSRAETPNKEYYIAVPAREYTFGPRTDAATLIAIKAPGCRFAVLAYALRPPTRRALEVGEEAPKGADVNDDGVLAYGPVYVLNSIPRRLKAKLLLLALK